jgi:ABC-2 type transport system permease protein
MVSLGFYTLYCKEVKRFAKVYNQTLIAPLISSLLLLAVFSLALGNRVQDIQGIGLQQFIIPGLIMMTVVQNAFANTSSTLVFGKVLGIIIDVLIPPLSSKQVTLALALGGVTRGVAAGLVVALAVFILGLVFDESLYYTIHDLPAAIFYLFFASLMLSLLGMVAGIISESFDQMSAVTSFIITPLSFLSGTFYSIQNLPLFWQKLNLFNPFFYMIDGFRYSITGHSDADLTTGAITLLISNIILFIIVYKMLDKGYRIKS